MLNVNFDEQYDEINNVKAKKDLFDDFVIEDNKIINEGNYEENKLSEV